MDIEGILFLIALVGLLMLALLGLATGYYRTSGAHWAESDDVAGPPL